MAASGFITLEHIVRSIQLRDNSFDESQYFRMLETVIAAYMDLGLFLDKHTYKVAYLTMDSANRVRFPKDFLEYSLIGINIHGRLYTLTYDESILPPNEEKCGEDVAHLYANPGVWLPSSGYEYIDHYYNGRHVSGLYALGGGFNRAYYNIQGNMIQFSSQIDKGEVVIQYKATNVVPGEETMVPRRALEYLVAKVRWLLSEADEKPDYIVRRRKEMFEEEEAKYLTLQLPSIDELMDGFYESISQSPMR